jgi:hypothetical protein
MRARALAISVIVLGGWLLFVETVPLGAQATTGPSVARVAALAGRASVVHFGSKVPVPLAVDARLFRADTVNTEADGKARIVFEDETAVTVAELTTLRITQFPELARARSETTRLTVLAGAVRVGVKPATARSPVELWTATAVAAVRGTEFLVDVTADATGVAVLEGRVAVSNLRPDVRGSVLLGPGEGTDVRGDNPPTPSARWGPARLRALEQRTRLP